MIKMSCFQLPVGKLYTIFSIKWIFILNVAIFEIGSAICGAAPNSTVLIIGRAISGLGCSGIVSGALTILSKSVPLSRRPIFTGIIGAMFAVASLCGPPLGGVLTDHVSWRWCFYSTLPRIFLRTQICTHISFLTLRHCSKSSSRRFYHCRPRSVFSPSLPGLITISSSSCHYACPRPPEYIHAFPSRGYVTIGTRMGRCQVFMG